jgi:ribosome-binding factor A
MSGHRTDRVGALLQAALSELLLRGVKDPRIGMVTITGVKISPDLKHASVYVSTLGDSAAQARTLAGLASARSYLQSQAGRKLGLRFTPVDADTIDYQFTADDPTVWTRPWTAMLQLHRTNQPIYEFACHEGNFETMTRMLKIARLFDKP